jgi:hypothetical protein
MFSTKEKETAKQIVRYYFKDDNLNPFELTDGQAEIFLSIFLKRHNRIEIIASTQYGKSSVIAMALIIRTQAFKEAFAIVTGQESKSQIIMEKVIQHTFDHVDLYSQLEIDEPLDRIKRERSKKRITWKGGGEIRTFTADSKNRKRVKESLTGLGSPNIVEDEASLIPDDLQAMILRMLGGHNGGFLIKIGNPFYRNHFLKTWNSDKYTKLFIDYKQALQEGRYTEDFISEMRDEAFFDILYECKFPTEEEIDMSGYRRLLSDFEIENAKKKIDHNGDFKLAFDVGEGGDENAGVLRSGSYSEIVHTSRISDLMATTRIIIETIDKYKVKPENCFVDDTGIGAGITDRLHELGYNVNGIKWGNKSKSDKYANLKAENFMKLREWIQQGGCLEQNDKWNELYNIKFKVDTSGKIKIKTKEEMRKEGLSSPNVADALALTFNATIEDEAPKVW